MKEIIQNLINALSRCGHNVSLIELELPIKDTFQITVVNNESQLLSSSINAKSLEEAKYEALLNYIKLLNHNIPHQNYYLGSSYQYENEVNVTEGPLQKFRSKILNKELIEYYNSNNELELKNLFDINSSSNKSIQCMSFKCEQTLKETLFPINILSNLYRADTTAASTSIDTVKEKIYLQAIEIFAIKKIVLEEIELEQIPSAHLVTSKLYNEVKQKFEEREIKLIIKDSSINSLPSLCFILIHQERGEVSIKLKSAKTYDLALNQGLIELQSVLASKEVQLPLEISFEKDEVANQENLEQILVQNQGKLSWKLLTDTVNHNFTPWNDKETDLKEKITNYGFKIYSNLRSFNGHYTGQIIIPGMNETYPPEDLAWNNNNAANTIRDYIFNLHQLNKNDLKTIIGLLEDEGHDDERPVLDMLCISLDINSSWATLTIGELKCLILLALEHEEGASAYCDWIAHYGKLPHKRARFYLCVEAILKTNRSDKELKTIEENIKKLYGEKTYEQAYAHVTLSKRFYDLEPCSSKQDCFKEHRKLQNILRFKRD